MNTDLKQIENMFYDAFMSDNRNIVNDKYSYNAQDVDIRRNENGSYVDNKTGKVYNISDYLDYILQEKPNKIKYLPYTQNETFFELEETEMDSAFAGCSENALLTLENNDISGQYNDDKYVYKYDLIGKDGNFGITDVFEISNDVEEVLNEGYSKKNIDRVTEISNNEQKYGNRDISSVQDSRARGNVSDLASETGLTNNQRRNDAKQSNINKQNVKLEERVTGDALLNAQDFIEEVKSVGAEVDDNGYVTVYHQTTQENANKIKENGKMSAKEDGIFFSTSKEAQQADGKGDTKLTFKIPAEKLVLDDIFDNNADVKIPLKNKNEILDVSEYLLNENSEKGSFSMTSKEDIVNEIYNNVPNITARNNQKKECK